MGVDEMHPLKIAPKGDDGAQPLSSEEFARPFAVVFRPTLTRTSPRSPSPSLTRRTAYRILNGSSLSRTNEPQT